MISHSYEPCPKCLSDVHVSPKMMLIGKASPALLFPEEEKVGYMRKDQLAVDECKSEILADAPLEQFLEGLYCSRCQLGFIPDHLLADAKKLARRLPTNATQKATTSNPYHPNFMKLKPQTVIIAIQSVAAEIRILDKALQNAEDSDAVELEQTLVHYDLAAAELKTLYDELLEHFTDLPSYESLIEAGEA